MNVVVRSGDSQDSCQATVWIYSLDEQDILGPYNVSCEELLSVEIDERDWGVVVQSEYHVYVDVWIEEEEPLRAIGMGMIHKETDQFSKFINFTII